MFFFPFVAEAQASSSVPFLRALPRQQANGIAIMRPGASESGFAGLTVDLVRHALTSFTSSLTALGSRANALFAQTAAALAFERASRDTASSFGMSWPRLGLHGSASFGATWFGQPNGSIPPSLFALQSLLGPWAENPWKLLPEAFDVWMKFWTSGAARRDFRSYGTREAAAPFIPNFPMQAPPWGFAWGR